MSEKVRSKRRLQSFGQGRTELPFTEVEKIVGGGVLELRLWSYL